MMEISELTQKVFNLTKQATSYAKAKDFDKAIEILDQLISDLDKYELDHSSLLIKIIPYFQKAGKYSEVERYVLSRVLPILEKTKQKAFQHKSDMTQLAFIELYLYRIYDKLRLCAKREKQSADEQRFTAESKSHYGNYERYLALGMEHDKKMERAELAELFGGDVNYWPDSLKHLF